MTLLRSAPTKGQHPLIRIFLACLLLASASTAFAADRKIQLGSEGLEALGFNLLKGKRVGLLTNPSAINQSGSTTIQLLHRDPGVNLVALYGPEHGVYGNEKAGVKVADQRDPQTGLPVFSLYGAHRKPSPEMLEGIDVMVYDLQDTGIRSYTYISCMGLTMEACAEKGVEFVVLDRPNPLGGVRVEGPMLDPKFRSYVGQWEVPYLYGMTCGELAWMINGEGWISQKCKLTIVPMRGWKRDMTWKDTGLKWVPPSPTVATDQTAFYLAATGILGELGGGIVESSPPYRYQRIRGDKVDARALLNELRAYRLSGVDFLPVKYKRSNGDEIEGVAIRFTEPAECPLMALNVYIWEAVRKASTDDVFQSLMQGGRDWSMFDKVNGTDQVRTALQQGTSARKIVSSWKSAEIGFQLKREKYLIYR